MSNAETIKARVEHYLEINGNDCLLEDIATAAYERTVTEGELLYTADVVREAGYTYKTNIAIWGMDEEVADAYNQATDGQCLVLLTDADTGEEYYSATFDDLREADDNFAEIIETINNYLPSGSEAFLDLVDAKGEIVDGAEFPSEAFPFRVTLWEDKNYKISKSGIITHIHEIAAEETTWDLKTEKEAKAKFKSAKSDAKSKGKKGSVSIDQLDNGPDGLPTTTTLNIEDF